MFHEMPVMQQSYEIIGEVEAWARLKLPLLSKAQIIDLCGCYCATDVRVWRLLLRQADLLSSHYALKLPCHPYGGQCHCSRGVLAWRPVLRYINVRCSMSNVQCSMFNVSDVSIYLNSYVWDCQAILKVSASVPQGREWHASIYASDGAFEKMSHWPCYYCAVGAALWPSIALPLCMLCSHQYCICIAVINPVCDGACIAAINIAYALQWSIQSVTVHALH